MLLLVVKMNNLPAELLEAIVENIKLSTTLLNLKHASSKFSTIITPRMSELFFDKVYALIYPKLKMEDTQKLKMVCKRWNDSVCRFISTCSVHSPLSKTLKLHGPTVAYGYPVSSPQLRQFRIETLQCFDLVEKEIENHFSLGALQGVQFLPTEDLNNHDMEQYWLYAKRFVHKYGKHINVVKIGLIYCFDLSKQFSILEHMLNFLPNLVKLQLISLPYECDHQNSNDISKKIVMLPKMYLPNLECITFEGESNLYNFLKADEIHCKTSITKVEMGMWAITQVPHLLHLMSNITDLILFDVYSLVHLGKFFTKLGEASNNLRNLYINFTYKISTTDLFASIQDINVEKLTAEYESIEDGEIFEIVSGLPLQLPSIVSLAIDDTNELTHYEFLNWLPNLSYLILRGKGSILEEHISNASRLCLTLKKCLYTLEAPDLWLWKRMPKLQMLTVSNEMENFFDQSVYYFRPIELSF